MPTGSDSVLRFHCYGQIDDLIYNLTKPFALQNRFVYIKIENILSQSYNATVFYFDNISFLAHALNQLFLPN